MCSMMMMMIMMTMMLTMVDDNDDAKTGSFGIIKVDAATPTIPCTAPRLPIVVLVEVDFWPFSAEES